MNKKDDPEKIKKALNYAISFHIKNVEFLEKLKSHRYHMCNLEEIDKLIHSENGEIKKADDILDNMSRRENGTKRNQD